MSSPSVRCLAVCLTWCLPAVVAAQDMHLLDCYDVSPFGPGCAQAAALASPPAFTMPPQPLFTRETMAPTTPAVVVDYLNDITPEHADAVIDFEMSKWRDVQRATALLKERATLRKGRR
jgi:hypothetical protein